MRITKRQLKRIIREASYDWDVDNDGEAWEGIPAKKDSKIKESLDHKTKAAMVMEAVQQNLNDPSFVNWLFVELGMEE